MTICQPIPASIALRRSLKRGLSRQAYAQAIEADLPTFFRMTGDLAPNSMARDRSARRLSALRGVVRVALTADGIVAILRNRREVTMRQGATDLFSEPALVYTRVLIVPGRLGSGYQIARASFCLHALERLVERSPVALDRPLLPVVDAEAVALLRNMARSRLIEDGDDLYSAASGSGVWAGSGDRSGLEPDWNLAYPEDDTCVTVFSARTYLNPDQMRPTVWARWRDDPGLSIS